MPNYQSLDNYSQPGKRWGREFRENFLKQHLAHLSSIQPSQLLEQLNIDSSLVTQCINSHLHTYQIQIVLCSAYKWIWNKYVMEQ